VGLIVLMPTALQPFVSYRTHAIGFTIGLVAGILGFLARKSAIRKAEVIELDELEETKI
jgi:hypothetical protein